MTDSKEEEKKNEPTFKKIENGMVFYSEGMIAVGFPVEIETKKLAGGKIALTGANAEGEHYRRVKYDWRVISGSPLPEEEMLNLKDNIATSSGTVVASLANASITDFTQKCQHCGTPLLISGKQFYCYNCGKPTE